MVLDGFPKNHEKSPLHSELLSTTDSGLSIIFLLSGKNSSDYTIKIKSSSPLMISPWSEVTSNQVRWQSSDPLSKTKTKFHNNNDVILWKTGNFRNDNNTFSKTKGKSNHSRKKKTMSATLRTTATKTIANAIDATSYSYM